MAGQNKPKHVALTGPADLFQQARALSAKKETTPPAFAPTAPNAQIHLHDRTDHRAGGNGNVKPSFGVFEAVSTSQGAEDAANNGRAAAQSVRVNAASVYASAALVQALMAYPGVKGGGTEEEDRIIDDLLKRAITSTDRVVEAIGLDETNPRFVGHRNRLFRSQLDILAKAHVARYVHEFGVDDADQLADLQVRLAKKIDTSGGVSADGDVSYLDASIDVSVAKLLAKVEVASAIIDEIGRCRCDFGVNDPVTEIALPAAEHAADMVLQVAPKVAGPDYGKNRINDGMVETSLISSAAKIYRTCYANAARALVARLERMDEIARAAEFDQYTGENGRGWPTDAIHRDFDRYFQAVVGFVIDPPQAKAKTRNTDNTMENA